MSSIDVFSSGSHSAKINYATNLNVNCSVANTMASCLLKKGRKIFLLAIEINM